MSIVKKMIALLLALAMLLSTAALAETFVKFRENARAYKSKGGGKTQVVVKKGSVSYTEGRIGEKWTRVYVDDYSWMWFKSEHLKKTDDDEQRVMFVSGGKDKSGTDGSASSYRTDRKYVYATGKCNIRKSPALNGRSLGTLRKGATLKYLGKRAEDDRGVYWYKVRTKSGKTGWVSEVYTKLK